MKHAIFAIWAIVLASSCTSSNFGGNGTTKNKSDDKPRPTEEGEGVVGYLTDPSSLVYSEQDGNTTVTGGAGAVAYVGDTSVALGVCLQEVELDVLTRIVNEGKTVGSDDVKLRATGDVNGDGSFSISMAGTPTGVLAVNVSGSCGTLDSQGFASGDRAAIVFKQPGTDGFEEAAVFTTPDTEPENPPTTLSICGGLACDSKVEFLFVDENGVLLEQSVQVSFDVKGQDPLELHSGDVVTYSGPSISGSAFVDGYIKQPFSSSSKTDDAVKLQFQRE